MTIDYDALAKETEDFEGFRAAPYKDSRGFWTIGDGRCLETSPLTAAEWKLLLDNGWLAVMVTQAGARGLMEARLRENAAALTARLPWFAAAAGGVQSVLVEMSYQLGVDSLLGFHDFLDQLSKQRYAAAAADGRTTLWYKQTPARAEALMKQLEAL